MTTIVAWLRWAIQQIGQWWPRLPKPPSAPAGGTTVGGNVHAGRDFVGRDRIDDKRGNDEQ